jgi:hypothetical protein
VIHQVHEIRFARILRMHENELNISWKKVIWCEEPDDSDFPSKIGTSALFLPVYR